MMMRVSVKFSLCPVTLVQNLEVDGSGSIFALSSNRSNSSCYLN